MERHPLKNNIGWPGGVTRWGYEKMGLVDDDGLGVGGVDPVGDGGDDLDLLQGHQGDGELVGVTGGKGAGGYCGTIVKRICFNSRCRKFCSDCLRFGKTRQGQV